MRRLCCLTTALVGALGSALGYAPGGFAQQQSVYLARSQGADPRPNDSLDPISRAAEQVAQYSSLSAKVRQRGDVGGSSLGGTGV